MNVSETGAESKLRMENLYFTDIQFTRSEEDIADTTLKFKATKYIEQIESNRYKVALTVELSEDSNKVNVKLTAASTFSLSEQNGFTSEQREKIIGTNTVAIMFPYIRSQISLLTAQPNISPIVLPSMNIELLFDGKESNA